MAEENVGRGRGGKRLRPGFALIQSGFPAEVRSVVSRPREPRSVTYLTNLVIVVILACLLTQS